MRHITIFVLASVLFSGMLAQAQESQKCNLAGEKVRFQRGDWIKNYERIRVSRYLNTDENCRPHDVQTRVNIINLMEALPKEGYVSVDLDENVEPRCHVTMGLYTTLDQSQQVTAVLCNSEKLDRTFKDDEPEYTKKVLAALKTAME